MESRTKIVRLGEGKDGNVYCKIELKVEGKDEEGKPLVKLSISGVEGPKANGDARGSCGQIIIGFKEYDRRGYKTLDEITPAPGWTPELIRRFFDVWDRWHMNDTRAGCEHQRASWDTDEQLEVVSYHLTHEAYQIRERARKTAADAAIRGEVWQPADETERALAGLEDWFKDQYQPPDADSPLSGCYEVHKRETRGAGWVYPSQHPRGLLTKPCEVCGYKYGTEWRRENLPQDVIEFLGSLPETDRKPAWV